MTQNQPGFLIYIHMMQLQLLRSLSIQLIKNKLHIRLYDNDEDLIPCDGDGNNFAPAELHDDASLHNSYPLAPDNPDDASVTSERCICHFREK
jgi:hypothetical protein